MKAPTDRQGLLTIEQHALRVGDTPILCDIPAAVAVVADPLHTGLFLQLTAKEPAARQEFLLGRLGNFQRFTCCYRPDPWWMTPKAGTAAREIPVETQFLLLELTDGRCVVLVPLLDEPFRASLEGTDSDELRLVAETGDPAVTGSEMTGLFIAVGENPYILMHDAARSVIAKMSTGRLRAEKPLPDFMDYFGWCTWDAFYEDVNHAKVQQGLESFAEGGVLPKYLILDAGWQSLRKIADGDRRLSSFSADNEKFPGDLAPTIAMAKEQYGLHTFLVWHTLNGFWNGADSESLSEYRIVERAKDFSPGILHQCPEANGMSWFGSNVGVVAPEDSYRFFQDYHRHLRRQGVDGVKVDSQSTLESVAQGVGGRVSAMRRYHEALEGSVQTQFTGRLINCMSLSSDMLYSTLNSTLTRTSTDFWPTLPASHGLHLYNNAQVSLWFGEFVHPDWDMFQSGHPMGAFHAAARAIGGCPIYVSDKPDGHNFDVLRKLVLSDGTVLRAQGIGLPTRDCLFANPLVDDVLLKIFNTNERAGVIGVFNARYHEDEAERATLTGTVSPADVEGLAGENFIVYAHHAGTLVRCAYDEQLQVSLAEQAFELYTIVPIEAGVAPIGLADKYNSAGAVIAKGIDARGGYAVQMRDGGQFIAWCAEKPSQVFVDDAPYTFDYNATTSALSVNIRESGTHDIRITGILPV
ncbi:MAG: Sip1-related alpha-galactosidase [Armatimonadota bacterium]